MKHSLAAAFIALSSAAQAQAGLNLAVDNVSQDGAYAKAVVRVTNDSARAYRAVSVSCAFMANGRALETSDATLANVPAGQTVFGTVLVRQTGIDQARCRITKASP